MSRRTGKFGTFVLGALAVAVVLLMYVLSAAPALRLADGGTGSVAEEGAPRAWAIFYRPVTWLMQSTKLRGPLSRWSELWVSREALTAAVDGWIIIRGSGGTISSLSIEISCTVEDIVGEEPAEEDEPAIAETGDEREEQ